MNLTDKVLSQKGISLFKKAAKKALPLIFVPIIGLSTMGTLQNCPKPQLKKETYDYTTDVTPVSSERINAFRGGVIEVDDLDSLIDEVRLTIPSEALIRNTRITMGEVNNPPELPVGFNYVGTPVDLGPDNTTFESSLTIEIPYSDETLSDAGVSDETTLKLYSYDISLNSWEEIPILKRDTINNFVTAEINHFSYVTLAHLLEEVLEKDLGTPQPGDLLYKTGSVFNKESKMWMPGHVGIYTGEKIYSGEGLASEDVETFGLYNVIEALKDGVQYSYYNLPNITETYEDLLMGFENNDLYMGAREPKDFELSFEQREDIVEFVEAQIGKPYAWEQTKGVVYGALAGSQVKGPDEFNCVGLAEKAYEEAGVNEGIGLTTFGQEDVGVIPVLTPLEHYSQTKPAKGYTIDLDGNGYIDRDELNSAREMYRNEEIDYDQYREVIDRWQEDNPQCYTMFDTDPCNNCIDIEEVEAAEDAYRYWGEIDIGEMIEIMTKYKECTGQL